MVLSISEYFCIQWGFCHILTLLGSGLDQVTRDLSNGDFVTEVMGLWHDWLNVTTSHGRHC